MSQPKALCIVNESAIIWLSQMHVSLTDHLRILLMLYTSVLKKEIYLSIFDAVRL